MNDPRILVVDDEGPARNFIVDGLNALGITDHAIGAASAEDALASAARVSPDLIISDIRLAGLNGLDLARYLHQNHPQTKVILITGYSTRDIEKAAATLGVDALLHKPFGLDALGEAVRTALNPVPPTADERGLSPAKLEGLTRQIDILKRDAGAQWIGLIDKDGQIVIHTGSTDEFNELLNQAATRGWAGAIAATAATLGACFLYIEGQPHDIYLASVDRSYCLTFIYDRRWQNNRVGAVWLTAKHGTQELARVLSNQPLTGPPRLAVTSTQLATYVG
jgi:CheY-like chemotaxis protein